MYHYRNILGTKIECEFSAAQDFQEALSIAYQLSADLNVAVYVCRDSNTHGNPGYTEVASVKALP